MPHAPEQLAELTLALRALGSRRRRRGQGNEQERFFAPLLEARRAAARATDVEAAVAAFDATRLATSFDKMIRSLAEDRAPAGRAAGRRALEARLRERLEPLLDALSELALRADALRRAAGEDRREAWRDWERQLRLVFARADRCWPALDAALEATSAPRRGWFARVFRRGGR